MKELVNHSEIVMNIRDRNLEKAIILYKEKTKLLLSISRDPRELKKLLNSMNVFIYTYFCINSSIDLEELCYKNLTLLDKYHSEKELISLGKEIIKSYIEIINSCNPVSENEIIKQALDYIHFNIEKKITLETVAAHIHISSNYLCYLFKENTGYKFCEYVNKHRIKVAKEYLDNSSNPLDLISFKCGFNSQSHFSTTFKKYVGVSPNVYRKSDYSCIPNSLF